MSNKLSSKGKVSSKIDTFSYKVIMFTTFVISGCSMCYELIISAVSSYLLGDSIKQFSITIGLYMCAMGLGSFISRYIKKELFDWFIFVEIGVGIMGGLSSTVLFFSNLYLESYEIVMYAEIILIGTLVGIEIPVLTRIIEENASNLRVNLSTIFSFDYIGGLVGSIAFPLLLLPKFGYFATTFLVGALNLAIALVIIYNYKKYIKRLRMWKYVGSIALAFMISGIFYSENIANNVENGLYRDYVILNEQTEYQKIVMTKHKDDLRLFINGNIQFCSLDEYRYHEALVHPAMSVAGSRESVLILGGGDGLAVRELLKYDDVKDITLIDLDPKMIEICSTNANVTELNENALKSDKLTVINKDAYKYLENNSKLYDVIIVDLPDPNDESLNKLYTNLFYRLCYRALSDDGVMCVQSTSPYYANNAFWCINKTIESEKFNVYPYHLEVPSFGDWGFNLATKKKVDADEMKIGVETRYLNESIVGSMFAFAQDEIASKDELIINSLGRPQLLEYYMEAEEKWN